MGVRLRLLLAALLLLSPLAAMAEGEEDLYLQSRAEVLNGSVRYYVGEGKDCIQIDGSEGTLKIRDSLWFYVEPEGVYFLREDYASQGEHYALCLADGGGDGIDIWGVIPKDDWYEIVPLDGTLYLTERVGDSMLLSAFSKGEPLKKLGVLTGLDSEMTMRKEDGRLVFYRTNQSTEPDGHYDPQTGELKTGLEAAPKASAPAVDAPAAYTPKEDRRAFPTLEFDIAASSTLKPGSKSRYDARNVFDDDLSTCWAEGASGNGKGETITYTFNQTVEVGGFEIYGGYGKSAETYKENNRIKVLQVLADGIPVDAITLDDVRETQTYAFDDSFLAREVGFVIKDTYPGTKYDDTCISELVLLARVLGE